MVDVAAFTKNQAIPESPEIYAGYLTKQGGKYKTWRRRWFSVRGNQMLYFKEQGDPKPIGVITLAYPLDKDSVLTRDVSPLPAASVDGKQNRPYCFIIKGKQASQRTYMLCAESDALVLKWIDVCIGVIYSPKGGGMFGCSLKNQLLKEGEGPAAIPRIVVECCDYIRKQGLDESGIFRLSGRASRINELRMQYNMAQVFDINAEKEVHAVTGLLKRYLRELPEPLLTQEKFETVLAASTVYSQNQEEGLVVLQQLVRDIPIANSHLLKYLCVFLAEVAAKSDINKMTEKNLAVVFAPSLMQPPEDSTGGVLLSSAADIEFVTKMLIENYVHACAKIPEPDTDDWQPFRAKERANSLSAGSAMADEYDLDPEDDNDELNPMRDSAVQVFQALGGAARGGIVDSIPGSAAQGGRPHAVGSPTSLVTPGRQRPSASAGSPMQRTPGSRPDKPNRPARPSLPDSSIEATLGAMTTLPSAANSQAARSGRLVPGPLDSEPQVVQLQKALERERHLRLGVTAQLEALRNENMGLEQKNALLEQKLVAAYNSQALNRSFSHDSVGSLVQTPPRSSVDGTGSPKKRSSNPFSPGGSNPVPPPREKGRKSSKVPGKGPEF